MKPIVGDKVRIINTRINGIVFKMYENNTCDVLENDSSYRVEYGIDLHNISILAREYLIFEMNENKNYHTGLLNLIVKLIPVVKRFAFVGEDLIMSYSYDFESPEKFILHSPYSIYWKYLTHQPEKHKTITLGDFYTKVVTFDRDIEEVLMSSI